MVMTKRRAALRIGLAFCAAALAVDRAAAQLTPPRAKPPDGAMLFRQQCATCHTTSAADPPRQGPTLFNIVGREAGTADGFRYSAGFANAKFKWDEGKLDAWLADPQAMIPGAIMPYKQAKPEIRIAIMSYLKELH
jgi:cytochrome c